VPEGLTGETLLGHLRVLDFTTGIAGAYCCRMLADAGADVVKVEPPGGDPWRAWSAGGAPVDADEGGALFRFLHHGVRSVVGTPDDAEVRDLMSTADVVIEGFPAGVFDALALRERDPGLVHVSITPYGRTGPYADRPVTEILVQAESGALVVRGAADRTPIQAGGRITEWVSGTYAAIATIAAVRRARLTGRGAQVDLAMADVAALVGAGFGEQRHVLAGRPPITKADRSFETPSIEPTLDGYAGFTTNSRQQFDDFLVLIERADLLGDDTWALRAGRVARRNEWIEMVHAWTTKHETAEIVKRAQELRIPSAPVCNGETVQEVAHFVERRALVRDPTDTFTMPRRPWILDGAEPPPPRPSPRLGEHTGRVEVRTPERVAPWGTTGELPLAGIRVLDLTAWWAGPAGAGVMAALGADVIHVESITRIDGMRTSGAAAGRGGDWWEHSGHFLVSNTNKRDVTLPLDTPEGLGILKRLIGTADAIVENFTPRVLGNFGLTWDVIQELNPRCSLLRMPAFGLSGPWRDSSGFAQTMEQLCGLAWMTGERSDQPRIQQGLCDPNAGAHTVFALFLALTVRDATGRGCHFELPMVESALNAAAEVLIEATAYGNLIARDGNRSPGVAPQGVYACPGIEHWLVISVETDEQWAGLVDAIGAPDWARDPALATYAGRRAAHDFLDEQLGAWAATRDVDDAVELLLGHGVPAGLGRDPRLVTTNPQFRFRRFHEEMDHPEVGRLPVPVLPFRFDDIDHWLRAPAPTLGQHNHEILVGELGLTDVEFADLETKGLIGTRPAGL
jgi:crotonobetainyl-CoA:carnitine CoA-transferase CaiB-like acyl-CoA transferase